MTQIFSDKFRNDLSKLLKKVRIQRNHIDNEIQKEFDKPDSEFEYKKADALSLEEESLFILEISLLKTLAEFDRRRKNLEGKF